MRKLTFLAACTLAAATLFTACKKDEEETGITGSARKAALIANQWLLTGSTFNGASDYNDLAACDKDDIIIFAADTNSRGFNYFERANTVKCGTATADTLISSTWSMSADNSKLTFLGGETTITNFKANTFTVRATDGSDVITETYTKK